MNPELKRNLWLETSRRQMAGAGVILALIFAAVWLLDRGRTAYDFVAAGSVVFIATALVWGPRETRASVIDEVYGRTWDLQRLSALSPWTLTWGKLAGATSRVWVFAGVGLVIAFLQYASITSTPHALYWVVVGLGLAVLLQGSGLAVGLVEIRKARAVGRLPGLRSPGLIGLAFAVLVAGSAIWSRHHAAWTADVGQGALGSSARAVVWWGGAYDPSAFAALSLVVFGAWAVVWAWRLMRLELQLQNAPWAWPLFVLTAGLYAAGFAPSLTIEGGAAYPFRSAVAGVTFGALAYIGAFVDPADRIRARQVAGMIAERRLGGLAARIPLTAAPALLAALAAIVAAAAFQRAGQADAALSALACLAFLLRDLGVIAALRFAPSGRRSDLGVVVALVLLYVAGAIAGRAFGGPGGVALFAAISPRPGVSLLAGVGEAVLAWTFAAWRVSQPAEPRRTPGRSPAAPPGRRPWRA